MQSRRGSLTEAACGTLIGLLTAFAANVAFFTAIGKPLTRSENVASVAFFTLISALRSYWVRRLFNALAHRWPRFFA